jgi:hypothetical protein
VTVGPALAATLARRPAIVAGIALAVAGAFAGCAGDAGSIASPPSIADPTATPAPTPPASDGPPGIATDGSQVALQDTPFASDSHGYRLTIPLGWTVNVADGEGGLHPDEPGVDTFRDRFGHTLSIVAEPAPALDGWTSLIGRHLATEHALEPEATDRLRAAGRPVRLTELHLPIPPSYVVHYLNADLVDRGRGLTLSLESTTRDDEGDRRILNAFLASLEILDP